MIRHLGALATLMLVGLVIWMGCDLAIRGASGASLEYLVEAPRDLGRAGGIGPILISTGVVVVLATALAVLVSLPTAIVYTELAHTTGYRRIVYAVLDVGVGVPRIVWGLFVRPNKADAFSGR